MILACKIPRSVCVAVSGGPDSMAALSFCMNGKKDITVLHVDHHTPHAKIARECVSAFCNKHNIHLEVREVMSHEHNELIWREERLSFYKEFTSKGQYVLTAHHINDLVEWYLLTALHGNAKFMSF